MGYMQMTRSACMVALLGSLLIFNAGQAAAGENDVCNFRGNISTQGERIYHVPGQKYYDETHISASHGER